jgi:hypothetical protein
MYYRFYSPTVIICMLVGTGPYGITYKFKCQNRTLLFIKTKQIFLHDCADHITLATTTIKSVNNRKSPSYACFISATTINLHHICTQNFPCHSCFLQPLPLICSLFLVRIQKSEQSQVSHIIHTYLWACICHSWCTEGG